MGRGKKNENLSQDPAAVAAKPTPPGEEPKKSAGGKPGRKPGWSYVTTRAAAEHKLIDVLNRLLVGEKRGKKVVRMGPQGANAAANLLGKFLQSKMFTEEQQAKAADKGVMERLQQLEEMIERISEAQEEGTLRPAEAPRLNG